MQGCILYILAQTDQTRVLAVVVWSGIVGFSGLGVYWALEYHTLILFS